MADWSDWNDFPNPEEGDYLYAPIGPGVYELRCKDECKPLYCGSGKNVAFRMCSLLPFPLGQGGRRNSRLREYIFHNMSNIEYRTQMCETVEQARQLEKRLKVENSYKFDT